MDYQFLHTVLSAAITYASFLVCIILEPNHAIPALFIPIILDAAPRLTLDSRIYKRFELPELHRFEIPTIPTAYMQKDAFIFQVPLSNVFGTPICIDSTISRVPCPPVSLQDIMQANEDPLILSYGTPTILSSFSTADNLILPFSPVKSPLSLPAVTIRVDKADNMKEVTYRGPEIREMDRVGRGAATGTCLSIILFLALTGMIMWRPLSKQELSLLNLSNPSTSPPNELSNFSHRITLTSASSLIIYEDPNDDLVKNIVDENISTHFPQTEDKRSLSSDNAKIAAAPSLEYLFFHPNTTPLVTQIANSSHPGQNEEQTISHASDQIEPAILIHYNKNYEHVEAPALVDAGALEKLSATAPAFTPSHSTVSVSQTLSAKAEVFVPYPTSTVPHHATPVSSFDFSILDLPAPDASTITLWPFPSWQLWKKTPPLSSLVLKPAISALALARLDMPTFSRARKAELPSRTYFTDTLGLIDHDQNFRTHPKPVGLKTLLGCSETTEHGFTLHPVLSLSSIPPRTDANPGPSLRHTSASLPANLDNVVFYFSPSHPAVSSHTALILLEPIPIPEPPANEANTQMLICRARLAEANALAKARKKAREEVEAPAAAPRPTRRPSRYKFANISKVQKARIKANVAAANAIAKVNKAETRRREGQPG